jgi:intein-encoded DNA endonuclease-like protein
MLEKTTKEQRENLCKEYSIGDSIIKLSNKYGINYGRVYAILKNRKIPIRSLTDSHIKYKINKEYFSKIDSEDKAYFLGFLYADGSMNEKRHSLNIIIQEDDKEVLEKFIKCIGEDRPICYLKNRLRRPNEKNHVQLSIANTYLYKQLIDLGCRPKKSFTLEFPNIPKEFERHFIRGYFDGDGCWSFGKGKKALYRKFTFISTKLFL